MLTKVDEYFNKLNTKRASLVQQEKLIAAGAATVPDAMVKETTFKNKDGEDETVRRFKWDSKVFRPVKKVAKKEFPDIDDAEDAVDAIVAKLEAAQDQVEGDKNKRRKLHRLERGVDEMLDALEEDADELDDAIKSALKSEERQYKNWRKQRIENVEEDLVDQNN